VVLWGSVAGATRQPTATDKGQDSPPEKSRLRAWGGVRCQVKEVERAVAFYTKHLDFELEQQAGSAFARVSCGDLSLLLSGPTASGSRLMPDGRKQEPGGWNRIVLAVDDLPPQVAEMKQAGLRFRNEIEKGPGGKQVQLEDPDGNPVELFEPAG
jgi:glyoxylase I family protein